MEIMEICNQSAYGDALVRANIRQYLSGKPVRSVPAAIMTGYHDLIDVALLSVHKRCDIETPKYRCKLDFPVKAFHECTVNIRYLVKHEISNRGAAGKYLEKRKSSTTDENS